MALYCQCVVLTALPDTQGELKVSSVTGRLEPEFPAWRRNLMRYMVTLPIVVLSLLAVLVVMLLLLQLQVMIQVSH